MYSFIDKNASHNKHISYNNSISRVNKLNKQFK